MSAWLYDRLTTLEAAPFAEALRLSLYAYPVVNAAHILALGILVGSILPLDLRLLGLFRSVPAASLARVLEPVAAVALVAAIVTGFLLFSVEPLEYAANPALWIKLGLVAAGALDAGILRLSPGWRAARRGGPVRPWMRAAGLLSATIWIAAVFAGRFIAFIHVDPLLPPL